MTPRRRTGRRAGDTSIRITSETRAALDKLRETAADDYGSPRYNWRWCSFDQIIRELAEAYTSDRQCMHNSRSREVHTS